MFPLISAVLTKGDGDLLVRLQRREPQALAELYDRYGGMVYRLVARIVRDTGMAEDLVQETFLRAWNRASAFNAERGAVGPWLLAIARNRALDYLRAQGRFSNNRVELNETEHPSGGRCGPSSAGASPEVFHEGNGTNLPTLPHRSGMVVSRSRGEPGRHQVHNVRKLSNEPAGSQAGVGRNGNGRK